MISRGSGWLDANGPGTEASRLKAFGYSRDKRPDCVQKKVASGLSSRSVLERMSEIPMLDVTILATGGRELGMKRYTKPEKLHQLRLDQLGFTLPEQAPPEIRPAGPGVETF